MMQMLIYLQLVSWYFPIHEALRLLAALSPIGINWNFSDSLARVRGSTHAEAPNFRRFHRLPTSLIKHKARQRGIPLILTAYGLSKKHYKTQRRPKVGLLTPSPRITNNPDIRMLVRSPKLWSGPVVPPVKPVFRPAITSFSHTTCLGDKCLLLLVSCTGSLVHKIRCCFSHFLIRLIAIITISFTLTFVSSHIPGNVLVIVNIVEAALF